MVRKRIFFDSLCFVELALDAKGSKKLIENGKYIWPLRALLRASRDKQLEVFCSILSIAECIHADGKHDEEVRRLFRGMLTSGRSGVVPWQADIFVLERARDLRWKDGINLKPMDSIHIASALEAGCDEFITWDGVGLRKRQSIMKATDKLKKLGLSVIAPDKTRSIPDEYRQQRIEEL